MGDCLDHSINEANFWGDVFDYPGGGGAALAAQTVTLNFGIPIDYYVRMNFVAFERLVDEMGGVDIDVPEAIADPTYPDIGYGYDPFYLDAGPQHMDGRTALRYARTRATLGGDFDRALRQQQVALAVRDQALSNLPALVARAPALYDTLAGAYVTNLSVDQIVGLAWLAGDIAREDIQSAVIDQNYLLAEYTACGGRQLLVPDVEKIGQEIVQPLFLADLPPAPPLPPPTPTAASADFVTETEAARISVQNGTTVVGLAWDMRETLVAQGFNVVEVGNADRLDYPTTVIIDYTGSAQTVRFLAETLRVSPANIYSASDPNANVDVRVILGADYAPEAEGE
jgi:LCP family protein required for cell wall assembly